MINTLVADFIAVPVVMAFGVVHCIVRYDAFPSHTEQLMWRTSVITVLVAMLVNFLFGVLLILQIYMQENILIIVSAPCVVVCTVLLVISFTTLRSLHHIRVHQTVNWTTLIPYT